MHELGITENLLKTCLKEAEDNNISRITQINIRIGIFSGIVPECIQTYLDMLAEGTAAAGSKINAKFIPARVTCRNCQNQIETFRSISECPECKSKNLKVEAGNEFIIESIEAETD